LVKLVIVLYIAAFISEGGPLIFLLLVGILYVIYGHIWHLLTTWLLRWYVTSHIVDRITI